MVRLVSYGVNHARGVLNRSNVTLKNKIDHVLLPAELLQMLVGFRIVKIKIEQNI